MSSRDNHPAYNYRQNKVLLLMRKLSDFIAFNPPRPLIIFHALPLLNPKTHLHTVFQQTLSSYSKVEISQINKRDSIAEQTAYIELTINVLKVLTLMNRTRLFSNNYISKIAFVNR